jgi:hypothetical protein
MSAMPLPGIFSLLTPLLWVAAILLFATGAAERVAEMVFR